jgi:hypothetical protein
MAKKQSDDTRAAASAVIDNTPYLADLRDRHRELFPPRDEACGAGSYAIALIKVRLAAMN